MTLLTAALQNPALVGSFRPYLFVILAFGAAWLLVALWVMRIGGKMKRLAERMERDGGA